MKNESLQKTLFRNIDFMIEFSILMYNEIFKCANNYLYVNNREMLTMISKPNVANVLNQMANFIQKDALFALGFIYFEGKVIQRNINKAINFLTLAANQNHPSPQCLLGIIYYEGSYVARDTTRAIYYLTHAVNNDNPIAQYLLGVIYYENEYVKPDISKSIHYLSL